MMHSLSLPNLRSHALSAAVLFLSAGAVGSQWTQFGGPQRNFSADTAGLAESWSAEEGPAELWSRPLGSGYAGLAIDDGLLFTMYRSSREDPMEFTLAIDLETGKTVWEHQEEAPVPADVPRYGHQYSGPNATPLVVGKRVFSVGRNGALICLQADSGKLLWKQQLNSDFGAQTHDCGFSSSPIAYGELLLLPIGQVKEDFFEGRSLLAFDQASGEVVWTSQSFTSWHSSPIFIERNGQRQLVACTNSSLIGINPEDGSLAWEYSYPNPAEYEGIWASPVWDGEDTIFFSSRANGFAVRLHEQAGKTVAKRLWTSSSSPMGMGTPMLIDGLLVGAKRGQNASFMALDMETGERVWNQRLFTGATMVGDENRLVILDQRGELSLVSVNAEGLKIASQHQLTEQYSFTAPALVGDILYVRDEKRIFALNLSRAANQAQK